MDRNELNGSKWIDIDRRDQSRSQWTVIDGNGLMWTKMNQVDQIGPKGTEGDRNGST